MQRYLRSARSAGRTCLIGLVVVWSLAPIIWSILTSLKTRREIFASPPKIIFSPDFSAYLRVLERDEFWSTITHSALVAIGSTALVIIFASMAGYAFSRFRFRIGTLAFAGFLATRLLPPIVAVLPLYVLASAMRLVDTLIVLIVIYVALHLPLAIWLLRQYFDTIPFDIEEAAETDGASRLQVLTHITIPLAMPGVVAVTILMFVESWNEFMFASIFTDSFARTLPVLLAEGRGELVTDFQGIAALATIQMIPVILLALVAQRYLVGGLTAGAVVH